MFVAQGRKTLQLFPPSDYQVLYPYPAPKYHSSAIPPFTPTTEAPAEFPAYAYAHPIEVTLEAGDMLYLPAFWCARRLRRQRRRPRLSARLAWHASRPSHAAGVTVGELAAEPHGDSSYIRARLQVSWRARPRRFQRYLRVVDRDPPQQARQCAAGRAVPNDKARVRGRGQAHVAQRRRDG